MQKFTDIIEISHEDYLKIKQLPFISSQWEAFIFVILGDYRLQLMKEEGLEFASAYVFADSYTECPFDKKYLSYSFEKFKAIEEFRLIFTC